jgi:large conductance mechanosensitive channel
VLKGFKEFIFRGNVVELAVAVAIGTAFTALIEQFGKSFIKPLVALVGGSGTAVGGTFVVNGQVFDWAGFVNAVIFFVITAAVIYFVIVVPMGRIQARRDAGKPTPEQPAAPEDVQLLTEIRDLLRGQAGTGR